MLDEETVRTLYSYLLNVDFPERVRKVGDAYNTNDDDYPIQAKLMVITLGKIFALSFVLEIDPISALQDATNNVLFVNRENQEALSAFPSLQDFADEA